jgi:oligosaccharide repeat unit polymerase
MEFTIYNMLFFLAMLIMYQYREKKFTAVSYILAMWLASSIFSIFYVMSYGPFDRLTIKPYFYLELCFLISLYPVYKFDVNCLKNIHVDENLLNILILAVSVTAILPFFENLIHFIDTYILHPDVNTLFKMYNDKTTVGVDKYDLTGWISPIGRICNSITLKFQPLVLLSLFYYLTREKINRFRIWGLLLILANISLFTLLMSGRTTVTFLFLFFVFFYSLFRSILSKKILKKIVVIFIVVVGCIVIVVGILSIARFEGHSVDVHHNMFEWISTYLGGGLVDFNDSMWNISQYTKGDRSFSFFLNILGFDTYTDHMEFRQHWTELKTNVLPHRFYTYIGDWYSDLGLFTVLLIIVLSLIVRKTTSKRNSISFMSLYVYVSFCYVIVNGFMYYPILSSHEALGFVLCLIVCFILSIKRNNTCYLSKR